MTGVGERILNSARLSQEIQTNLAKRAEAARRRFAERISAAKGALGAESALSPVTPFEWWKRWSEYAVDLVQRTVLFGDALRQRGNVFVEHERAGKPPVLHFKYDLVLDGRTFERPVNYALIKIAAPEGITLDARRRPYVIIDPRAGHGPGIGGFKDDSQVGVALRGGHPVYFVIFYPEPEPGQTLLDVCAAEAAFIRKVRELHPQSPKPVIVGNCQGGWAAMMLAVANPDDTGPIVINGAPMSYWGGAWADGEGDNPMRYAGGLLGGSWLASFACDLGAGKFDGAHLVSNFENLNPANTFWDKYYNLFANIDKETPRFLEFERWWGGMFLMNREEIEWIVRNLFVGNKLWSGTTVDAAGRVFDLRALKVPIVLFASMGDNITPPQQAFNWVADVYGSTAEIKARGQTIVGLLHQDIGHLGIFVSGRVAKKEHAQLVSVLKSIERLPPGLWAMQIHERQGPDGEMSYEVDFAERSLEEVVARLNRFDRKDEQPFEAAAAVSELNQRCYELFVRPFVQAMSNSFTAEVGRQLHPLRFTRWAASDLNPTMRWLRPAAEAVTAQRQPLGPDHPLRRGERFGSELISASFDLYRDLRDAASEAAFFHSYGQLFLINPPAEDGRPSSSPPTLDPRQVPQVIEALQAIDKGGYAEAVARADCLLQPKGAPLAMWQLELRQHLLDTYRDLLPDLPEDEWRRIRGRQELITRYEPERALQTLPKLVAAKPDRERLLALLASLLHDKAVQTSQPTKEQLAAFSRIQQVLGVSAETGAGMQAARAGRPKAARRRQR